MLRSSIVASTGPRSRERGEFSATRLLLLRSGAFNGATMGEQIEADQNQACNSKLLRSGGITISLTSPLEPSNTAAEMKFSITLTHPTPPGTVQLRCDGEHDPSEGAEQIVAECIALTQAKQALNYRLIISCSSNASEGDGAPFNRLQ